MFFLNLVKIFGVVWFSIILMKISKEIFSNFGFNCVV